MNYLFCVLIGYGIGCISIAYLISRIKKIDLKKNGTGNLGAMNTTFVLGKKFGFIVMVFDMLKCILAIKLCTFLFGDCELAGTVAGVSCVLGHIFPFYLKFRGGKGLASFGGLILAYNPRIFLMLLLVGCALSIITNYSCSIPIGASLLFPYCAYHYKGNWTEVLILGILSVILLIKHRDNFMRAIHGTELTVTDFFHKYLGSK